MAVPRSSSNLARQAYAIRNVRPDGLLRVDAGRLTWRGTLHPSPLCEQYDVVLQATEGKAPCIFVASPALVPNEDGMLPHVYDNGSLCLFRRGQWNDRMLVVDTVLPWASEWLFAYELWRIDGVWHGDGPEAYNPKAQAALLHPFTPPPEDVFRDHSYGRQVNRR